LRLIGAHGDGGSGHVRQRAARAERGRGRLLVVARLEEAFGARRCERAVEGGPVEEAFVLPPEPLHEERLATPVLVDERLGRHGKEQRAQLAAHGVDEPERFRFKARLQGHGMPRAFLAAAFAGLHFYPLLSAPPIR
jgi:hypothetical protein